MLAKGEGCVLTLGPFLGALSVEELLLPQSIFLPAQSMFTHLLFKHPRFGSPVKVATAWLQPTLLGKGNMGSQVILPLLRGLYNLVPLLRKMYARHYAFLIVLRPPVERLE